MRLKALQQRQKELAAEGRTLSALPDDQQTAEQKARLLAIVGDGGELDAVARQIAAEQKLVDAERALIVRDGAGADVTQDRAVDRPWGNFGTYLQSVHRAHSGGLVDVRLSAAATGMGTEQGADGGFAVPTEFAPGIEQEMWDTGQLLSRVNDRPIGGNAITFTAVDETSRATGSRSGAVQAYWVDEGTAPDASRIKLARIEMKLRKVAALGYITDELMADAPALAGELTEAFTRELQFAVEDAIIRGTGGGQPQGILNATALVSVAKETGQAAATIVYENLLKMHARIHPRSMAGAVWLANVDTQPQLHTLALAVGTGGLPATFVNYGADGAVRIFGKPVLYVEYCETLGTKGDIFLVDLSRYRLIRKAAGVETASSMHVRFTQGEQTFRATYRVDGQPIPRSAITPYKGTATLSPFISLDTRA